MAGDTEPAAILARIRAIIEDEQRLEQAQRRENPRYNEADLRAFCFRRIANLILDPSDRIT